MEKLTDRKKINQLTLIISMAYMVSYMTRSNYGAVIAEMERDTGIARSLLSMAVTGSFITYGAGQIVTGILGDRFSPKKLISFGFLLTTLMNLLIPLCQTPYQMLLVWCVNGFAQSFMWPPAVRMMTVLLTDEDYKSTTVKLSWGGSFGTILVYLLAPLLISLWGWRSVFIVSALFGALVLILWNKNAYEIPREPKEAVTKKNKSFKVIFTPVMLGIMLAIILQGILRDGVTTWMPSYISDTYNLSSVISIFTGVFIPLFAMASFQYATKLYQKVIKNPITCGGAIFFLGTLMALVLWLITGKSAVGSVIFTALLTSCMHGVNIILICYVPPFFARYGNVSTVSGVLNSCTYIGSAISAYGIALVSVEMGWSVTVFLWMMIALFGGIICMICAKPWDKKWK